MEVTQHEHNFTVKRGNTSPEDHAHIIGWGSDRDKNVRPAHQMWKIPEEGTGAHWDVPEQQPNFKDFYSIERPAPTHVFGTSVPPKGVSGVIRKVAFKFSEGEWEHWLLLLFADRVNVVEGLFEDVLQGTRPRLLKERGWDVDKKFKTKRYKRVVAFSFIAVLLPFFFLAARKDKEVST